MQFPVLQQQDLVVYPSHIYQSASTTTSPKLSILPSPIPLPLSNHQSVFYVPDQGTRSRTHMPQLSVSMSQLKILYVATNTRRSQVNKYVYLKKKKKNLPISQEILNVYQSLSHAQLFVPPWTAAARLHCPWNSPGRILEWVAISFSRVSSQPRDQTRVSCTAGRVLCHLSHQGNPNTQYITVTIINQYSKEVKFMFVKCTKCSLQQHIKFFCERNYQKTMFHLNCY